MSKSSATAPTACRKLTKQASFELKAVKYTQGPGTYVTAGILIVVAIAVAVTGGGTPRSIIAIVVCTLFALGIVGYYRFILLPSFNQLFSEALRENDDGTLCVHNETVYEEFRDTYINRARSGGGGGFVGGLFGGMIGSRI